MKIYDYETNEWTDVQEDIAEAIVQEHKQLLANMNAEIGAMRAERIKWRDLSNEYRSMYGHEKHINASQEKINGEQADAIQTLKYRIEKAAERVDKMLNTGSMSIEELKIIQEYLR